LTLSEPWQYKLKRQTKNADVSFDVRMVVADLSIISNIALCTSSGISIRIKILLILIKKKIDKPVTFLNINARRYLSAQ
jgi:hypothetical protein